MLPKEAKFYKIINNRFPFLRFPKRCRLGVCDICVQIQTAKVLAVGQSAKEACRRRMREHTILHSAEREEYARKRKKAENSPELIMSIITDNSDKFLAPHRVSTSHYTFFITNRVSL